MEKEINTTKKRIFYNFKYAFKNSENNAPEIIEYEKVSISINNYYIKLYDENSKLILLLPNRISFVATPIYEND